MRLIPQILRYYLVFNSVRSLSVDVMLDHCDSFPHLLHVKQTLLHDIPKAYKLIDDTLDELGNGTFHFKYRSRKEQGKDYDPMILWEEDIAEATYTNWQLMEVCRNIRTWLSHQRPYKYPAEIYESLYSK